MERCEWCVGRYEFNLIPCLAQTMWAEGLAPCCMFQDTLELVTRVVSEQSNYNNAEQVGGFSFRKNIPIGSVRGFLNYECIELDRNRENIFTSFGGLLI